MSPREKLIEQFKTFPGIGPRQASRFVYHLLKKGHPFASTIAESLSKLHSNTKLCPESFQYFDTDNPNETRSPIARDPRRTNSELIVVEKDSDILAIEKSHAYTGKYFVVGNLVSMTNPKKTDIRLDELFGRIHELGKSGVLKEIILGFSYSPEAEHTRMYIQSKIDELCEEYQIQISLLGRGLAFGSEIEYMDPETLKNALQSRK